MTVVVSLLGRVVHTEDSKTSKGYDALELVVVETTINTKTQERYSNIAKRKLYGNQVAKLKESITIGDAVEVKSQLVKPDLRDGDCKRVRWLKDLGFHNAIVVDPRKYDDATFPTPDECKSAVDRFTKGAGFRSTPPPQQPSNDNDGGWGNENSFR